MTLNDSEILDAAWKSKCDYLFNQFPDREINHQNRIVNLKRGLDSLELIYLPGLIKEKDSIISLLSSSEIECQKNQHASFLNSFDKKRLYNWDYVALFYPEKLPHFSYGLKYIYQLMIKYPSTLYAMNNWGYVKKCKTETSIFLDNTIYLTFEKALSTMIENYYPSYGMIYYSPYNKYTIKDLEYTKQNMLLYYLKNM